MNTCDVCGEEVDDFEICNHRSKSTAFKSRLANKFGDSIGHENDDFMTESDLNQRSLKPYLYAPLFALVFDLVIPMWDTWWIRLLYILLATVLVNQFASLRSRGGVFSSKVFFRGLFYSLNTPKIIRSRSSDDKRNRNIATWITVLVATFVLLFSLGTPGNSSGLEKIVTSKIKETTGLSPSVSCPNAFLTFPGNQVICRVKTILGITIPVTIKMNSPFTDPAWKLDY